jgi:hypothetical protein
MEILLKNPLTIYFFSLGNHRGRALISGLLLEIHDRRSGMARKPRLFAPGILYHVIRAWAVSRQRTVIGYVLVRRGGYGVKEVAEYFEQAMGSGSRQWGQARIS